MKKFGFATVVASGLAAAVLGFAGPAQADSIHHDWVHDIQQQVSVPQVDNSVQQSRGRIHHKRGAQIGCPSSRSQPRTITVM